MMTLVRTYIAQSGKSFELISAVKISVARGAKITGIDFKVAGTLGGIIGEVAVICNYNNMAHLEESWEQLRSDEEWRAANTKGQELCVSGASRDHIYLHY